jgi:hypothetical protein
LGRFHDSIEFRLGSRFGVKEFDVSADVPQRGGIDMTSRVLSNSEMEEFMSFVEADCSADSIWNVPPRDAPAFAADAEELSDSVTKDGNCWWGTGIAIGIEASAALFCYGVWQLWHVLR